jgi:hypothetical protein
VQFRGTQDHILLSQFLRLPQPGGPGTRTYILQEQGGPVIPPGTGFPFRRLLRLAESITEVMSSYILHFQSKEFVFLKTDLEVTFKLALVHYHIHKSLQLVYSQSHTNPILTLTPYYN